MEEKVILMTREGLTLPENQVSSRWYKLSGGKRKKRQEDILSGNRINKSEAQLLSEETGAHLALGRSQAQAKSFGTEGKGLPPFFWPRLNRSS